MAKALVSLDPKFRIFNSELPADLKLSDLVSTDINYHKPDEILTNEYTHLSKKHQQLKKYKRQSSQQDHKVQELSSSKFGIQGEKNQIKNSRGDPSAVFLTEHDSNSNGNSKNAGELNENSRQKEFESSGCKSPIEAEAPEKVPKLFIDKSSKKSKMLPVHATMIMNEWFEAHKDKPYPTEVERIEMAQKGKLNNSINPIHGKTGDP